jgi:hypothetical protein
LYVESYAKRLNFLVRTIGDKYFDKSVLAAFLRFDRICDIMFDVSKETKAFSATPMFITMEQCGSELQFLLDVAREDRHQAGGSRAQAALADPGSAFVPRPPPDRHRRRRLATGMQECDFVHITEPPAEELLVPQVRRQQLLTLMRDLVMNACIQQKRTVIFVRDVPRNEVAVRMLSDFVSQRDFAAYFSKASLEDDLLRDGCHCLHERRLGQKPILTKREDATEKV